MRHPLSLLQVLKRVYWFVICVCFIASLSVSHKCDNCMFLVISKNLLVHLGTLRYFIKCIKSTSKFVFVANFLFAFSFPFFFSSIREPCYDVCFIK